MKKAYIVNKILQGVSTPVPVKPPEFRTHLGPLGALNPLGTLKCNMGAQEESRNPYFEPREFIIRSSYIRCTN